VELDQHQQAIAWTFVLALTCGWAYEVTKEALEVTIGIDVSPEILDLLTLNGEPTDHIEAKIILTWDPEGGSDECTNDPTPNVTS